MDMIKLPRGLLLSADDAVAGGYSWSSWAESELDVAHHTFILSSPLRRMSYGTTCHWRGAGKLLSIPTIELLTQIYY